eukprot:6178046-Pleurochrysis_carterae.AAC.2
MKSAPCDNDSVAEPLSNRHAHDSKPLSHQPSTSRPIAFALHTHLYGPFTASSVQFLLNQTHPF